MMSSTPFYPGTEKEFDKALHAALKGLYNPAVLRSSQLIPWLGFSHSANPEFTLRNALLASIEAFHPQHSVPSGSKTWRVYHILCRRFTEQVLQYQVANELKISLRQLQREEKIACAMLGDFLRKTYQPDQTDQGQVSLSNPPAGSQPGEPGFPSELKHIQDSLPVRGIKIHQLLQEGLATLKGVLHSAGIALDYVQEGPNPLVFLQVVLFRQGFLNLLNTLIGLVPGGKIVIQVNPQQDWVHIDINAFPVLKDSLPGLGGSEGFAVAESFFDCCNVSVTVIETTAAAALGVIVKVPVLERKTVLVIEDHEDTLQLFQRYLADSGYFFLGARSVREGLEIASQTVPQVIVLDVMMPESDGWEFLGQARVHPLLQNIPVIVYSIISQASLALSLGASEFLQKPVSRSDLLAALDRQASRSLTESG